MNIITPTPAPAQRATEVGDFHEFLPEELRTDHERPWETVEAPRPFNAAACQAAYRKCLRSKTDTYPRLDLTSVTHIWDGRFGVITDEEARFWLHALTNPDTTSDWREDFHTRAHLDAFDPDAEFTAAQATVALRDGLYERFGGQMPYYYYEANQYGPLVTLLRQLFGPVAAARVVFEAVRLEESYAFFQALGPTQGYRDELTALLDEFVDISALTLQHNYSVLYYTVPQLLCRIPSPKHIRAVLDYFIQHRNRYYADNVRRICFALDDFEEVTHYIKALNLKLDEEFVRLYFARFGFEHVADLLKLLSNRGHRKTAPALLEVAAHIHTRDMVPGMLEFAQRETTMDIAGRWLRQEGANAIDGLIEQVGRRGKKRRWAIEQLRQIDADGHGDQIEQLLEGHRDTAQALVRQEVLEHEHEHLAALDEAQWPDWMQAACDYELGDEDAAYFDLDEAPQLLLAGGEHAAPAEVTRGLLAACLRAYPLERPKKSQKAARAREAASALLDEAAAALDAARAADWTWYLLERWWAQDFADDRAWVFSLVGHFSDDSHVTRLEPRVRSHKKWFGRRARGKHAKRAISAIARLGTPQALTALHHLANTQTKKTLREHAERELDQIRQERSWTPAQLLDRIVPCAGLDEHGTHVFDYGPRKFELVFRGAFDIELVDEDGKHWSRIPPVRKSDDIDCVSRAKADYRVIRDQLKQLIAEQTGRFEQAMITGQRWPAAEWREYVLSHPLLMHFARKLVWVALDASGEEQGAFLPGEDHSLINAEYEPVELDEAGHVRLCHAADLTQDERLAWAELMTDFELVQPFDQLNRRVYTPADSAVAELMNAPQQLFEGYYYWQTLNLLQRELDDGWEIMRANYEVKGFWRDFDEGRVVVALSNDLWEVPEGAKKPSLRKRVYFMDGPTLEPSRRFSTRDVPPRLYSEAAHTLEHLRDHFTP